MNILKKKAKRIFILALTVGALISTSVFASGGKLVEVTEEYYKDEIELGSTVSISNVVGTLDKTSISIPELYHDLNSAFEIELPSVITLLKNNALDFNVYKLTETDKATYKIIDGSLPAVGKVTVAMEHEISELGGFKDIDLQDYRNGKYPDGYTPGGEGWVNTGSTVTITEQGEYVVIFNYGFGEPTQVFISIGGSQSESKVQDKESNPQQVIQDKVTTATPTSSKVLINGVEKSFDAYNINNSNYLKLRDFAYMLNDTSVNIDIGWDSQLSLINILYGSPYTANGSEMARGDGKVKNAKFNMSNMIISEKEEENIQVSMEAYMINDNNYLKLRDMADLLGLEVGWDEMTQTIVINTL